MHPPTPSSGASNQYYDSHTIFPASNDSVLSIRTLDTTHGQQPTQACDLLEKLLQDAVNTTFEDSATSDTESMSSIEVEEPATPSDHESDHQRKANSAAPLPLSKTLTVEMPASTLLVPRNHYEPFEAGCPILSEQSAIENLLRSARPVLGPDEFHEIQLDDFVIYTEEKHYGVQMRSLIRHNTQSCYFDGRLSFGEESYFVRRVAISTLPIGNYGTLESTVRDEIWITSPLSESKDLYYRLNTPAVEYKRFFEPFAWVTDLAKHFVDYINSRWEEHRMLVTIHDFKAQFVSWVVSVHGDNALPWLTQHPSNDYRTSIVAYLEFIRKEAIGVLGEEDTYRHTLWNEVWTFQQYQRVPSPDANIQAIHPTFVTPYIMALFNHLPFGQLLKALPFSSHTKCLWKEVSHSRGFPLLQHVDKRSQRLEPTDDRIHNIKPGDTISTPRDTSESGSKWIREEALDFHDVDRWFARVLKVHNRAGRISFDVLWYYRPVDTLCGIMKYPWSNELFISDHCSCAHTSKITQEEVLGVHDVDFFGSPSTRSEFFCRQTYIHEERKWISLQRAHLFWEHVQNTTESLPYTRGNTVLVHTDKSSQVSEPCEIIALHGPAGIKYKVRRLLRRAHVQPNSRAPKNELLYSEQVLDVRDRDITGSCSVRFFDHRSPISSPYDRAGVGSLFYITHKISQDGSIRPLCAPFPLSLHQGFDPGVATSFPKLRGLDLFCGGGNFGRGLEDGGAIQMQYINDFDTKAVHTYMANVDPKDNIHPFLGSIDDLYRLAAMGRFSKSVPRPGSVDFISAGSPCPGFSRLTNDKTTTKQRKNQSLIAAFASFIDLYRPKYGLLENVPSIVQKKEKKADDVFSQLACALVGLGYQIQLCYIDACSLGSPQRRSRIFVAFAAPGYTLPTPPQQTHLHPPGTRPGSVGKLPTGDPMVTRSMLKATPFTHIPAAEATADLPYIWDAKPDICVPFPDHRTVGQTSNLQHKINSIPTLPYGMDFAKAWYGITKKGAPGSGVLTVTDRHRHFPADRGEGRMSRTARVSSAYGRQDPTKLIETVVTKLNVGDAKAGRAIHSQEPRMLSLMEARRAQGFPDEDVLLGELVNQYKIVGNSVAREVAVAWGLAFRDAYEKTLGVNGDNDLPQAAIQETPFETANSVTSASASSIGESTNSSTDSSTDDDHLEDTLARPSNAYTDTPLTSQSSLQGEASTPPPRIPRAMSPPASGPRTHNSMGRLDHQASAGLIRSRSPSSSRDANGKRPLPSTGGSNRPAKISRHVSASGTQSILVQAVARSSSSVQRGRTVISSDENSDTK
ncbi:uncharacterized protein F5Z01DRAFT_664071 [Emericellopsis atlantica]|uniref:DNA (cytosine-5-)-methyltransferase n=1 Tax=Emericellopsis atlantica TaxID=2614577 RepID=A0A9P7ZGI0_9HYPO|nr:uncharacterized protein F5Z01DRAFT_664071 [Emericellopsis atlantica]KAG9251135.1 hypothetical protein F5Z01DRAFT_664071 [Emericellopsis atlantica]